MVKRKLVAPKLVAILPLVALALTGCHSGPKGGVFASRKGVPDEFAVGRAAPLTVPPDFALVPPKPGQPRPQEADSSTQAINALFGGQHPVSAGEAALTAAAGGSPPAGIRSEAGDPNTVTVNKGSNTQAILKAPPSTNPSANATTPQLDQGRNDEPGEIVIASEAKQSSRASLADWIAAALRASR